MTWLYCLQTAILVVWIAWRVLGRVTAPRNPRALRVLLGKEEPKNPLGPSGFDERAQVAALEDALVKAGWRHENHIKDPEHHDEAGRYLFWGD